jgi:hypothetical protein
MKGILAVVGLTGAVFVSGFAYSPGTDKAASESLYGEVMMPGEWTPAVGIPVPFGRSGMLCARYIKGPDLAVGCYSAKPRLDFILDYKAYHSHRLLRPELVDWSRR